MKQSLFLCLLTILFSCTAQTDITPTIKSDAPELDFSKAQIVNEFQYDGVFTLTGSNNNKTYLATYAFYGAEAKALKLVNDRFPNENSVWYDAKLYPFLGRYGRYNSGIWGRISINDVELNYFGGYLYLDNLKDFAPIKYNAEKGLTWNVLGVSIPNTDEMKTKNNLSSADASSFLVKKEEIKVFPQPVILQEKYSMAKGDKDLTIKFETPKNADVIYVQFDHGEVYPFLLDYGFYNSKGLLKYLKGDANSINVTRSELKNFVANISEVAVTVTAIKFYSEKNGSRNFLYKNVSTSTSKIIIE
jgi:hypothetical protein